MLPVRDFTKTCSGGQPSVGKIIPDVNVCETAPSLAAPPPRPFPLWRQHGRESATGRSMAGGSGPLDNLSVYCYNGELVEPQQMAPQVPVPTLKWGCATVVETAEPYLH